MVLRSILTSSRFNALLGWFGTLSAGIEALRFTSTITAGRCRRGLGIKPHTLRTIDFMIKFRVKPDSTFRPVLLVLHVLWTSAMCRGCLARLRRIAFQRRLCR